MNPRVLMIAAVLLALGCLHGSAALAQQTPVDSFDSAGAYTLGFTLDGRERRAHVFVPPGYDPQGEPVPLVLVLHGAGGAGASIATFSGFNELAAEAGFVVAYPDGYNRAWNDARPSAQTLGVDDVSFISRLIDFLAGQIHIDSARIYAAGYSMGGMMAFRLGCQLQDKIAAVVSVASTFPAYQLDACLFADPVPVLTIQGTEDEVIPAAGYRDPYGNRLMLSVDESLRYWVQHNRCDPVYSFEALPDLDPDDGTRVRRTTYADCANEAEVSLLLVRGGGHTWPGYAFDPSIRLGQTSLDFSAAEAAWEFFARHPRRP